MPFRGPGMHEVPPAVLPPQPPQPLRFPFPPLANQLPAPDPLIQGDKDIERDQKLHADAERLAQIQEYANPIMVNERRQRINQRRAMRAAPKPGADNLVPKGMDPFNPQPAPVKLTPGRNPFGPKQ